MTPDQMKKLVERQLEAYNKRDLQAFCACYHSRIHAQRLIPSQPPVIGIEAFSEVYRKLFANNPKLHCELKSRIVLKDSILDEEKVTGIENSPEGLHAVAIYGFQDGLISEVWFTR